MAVAVRQPTKLSNSSPEKILQCTRCFEVKEIDQFRRYVDKDGKERWRYECKACASKYNARYHSVIQSLPYKKKLRDAAKAKSARNFYHKHKNDPEFRAKQRERHRQYRKKITGKYFLVVKPILPLIHEFEQLHGQGSVAEISGYSNDFIRNIINGDYTVIRVDAIDTILIRCSGPGFALLYDGAKRYFPDDGHGKFLGRNIPL